MFKPYPLICAPVFKSTIWGGRRLERYYSDTLPRDAQLGEAWIVADLKEGASTIVSGELAGKSLTEIFKDGGGELAGPAWDGAARFPLLIKLIDASDDLSVQVHPGDEDCERFFPDEAGKDETWIILESNAGRILKGFAPGTDAAQFEARLRDGSLPQCLREVAVRPGDALRVAPGTVHAVCRGVLLLEIQQPSDSTFRIYDYGRLGEDGLPRPTHLDQARRVLHFAPEPQPLLTPLKTTTAYGAHELIVDVPAYRIERALLQTALRLRVDPRSLQVLLPLDAPLTIEYENRVDALHPGCAAILPATLGEARLSIEKPTTIIAAGAGDVAMLPFG